MTPRRCHLLTAAIFAAVAVPHAARIAFGWTAVIGGWAAPMWARLGGAPRGRHPAGAEVVTKPVSETTGGFL